MNLGDYFAESFKDLGDTAIAELIANIPAFNFDSEELEGDLNLSQKVGVGEAVGTDFFLQAFVENKLNNIVQTSNDDIFYELFIASIILKKPRLFLNNPLSILNSQDAAESAMRVWQENFNSSDHKEKVLVSLQRFIGRNKAMNRLADNIMIVIDELFSNALFSAPVDENGKRLFKDLDRNEKVKYPGTKTAKIFAVHTTDNLFIGTVDPWGSVNRDGICKSLHRAYTEGKFKDGAKGAGLGLRMMLDRARSLYILSESKKRSLICCHMRLNISLKKIESVPKQLHINCF